MEHLLTKQSLFSHQERNKMLLEMQFYDEGAAFK